MYYKAKHAFGVMFEGEFITVSEGEPVPDTRGTLGAKLLRQLGKAGVEEHFVEETERGRFDHKPREAGVEQATAAPGEKRQTSHPRKSARKRTTTRAKA